MVDLTYRNVYKVCASVDLNQKQPTIDLSDVTWFEPYSLIYIGMFLRYYNRRGIYFNLNKPIRQDAQNYLTSQNFWERFNFDPDPEDKKQLLPFVSQTSFNDIRDLINRYDEAEDVGSKLTEVLQRNSVRVDITLATEAITELVQNFVEHAEEGLAAMMVQYYPRYKQVRIAIGDCGIGIKESLLQSGYYPMLENLTHKEAIAEAFKPCVTSKHEGGMGFDFVKSNVAECKGELFLSSYNGCVYIDKHGKLYYMDVPYSLPGVQVELCFPERR